MSEITFQTASAEETVELGQRLASILREGDVIALVGPLGAGKTQLTRGIAAGLGADPRQVASPTFVLMSEYEAPTTLVHIDAYRIHSLADLESIGFTLELIERSVTVIEWADRIEPDLPPDHLRIQLDHAEGGRQITLTPVGSFATRAPELALSTPPSATRGSHPSSPPCRICGRPVAANSQKFPFCSDRCRLVDLNKWFTSGYSISRPLDEKDEED